MQRETSEPIHKMKAQAVLSKKQCPCSIGHSTCMACRAFLYAMSHAFSIQQAVGTSMLCHAQQAHIYRVEYI